MQRVWLSIMVLAVFVLVATGCGKKKASDTAAETVINSTMRASGQDASVTVNSGTMQVKSKDGDMSIGEGTKLPDNWPDDVAVYKGLKLLSATKSKEVFSIQGSTADSQGKVAAFYKEQAKKSGWTEESVTTQPQMAMMMYSKEKRSLTVMITGQESGTSVSITIGTN